MGAAGVPADGAADASADTTSGLSSAASLYVGRGLDAPVPAALRISAFHASGAFGKPPAQHLVALAAAGGSGGLEHARRMLGLIVRFGQRLVAPYVPVLLRALLPHAWGHDGRGAIDPLAYLRGTVGGSGAGKVATVVYTPSLLAALGELSAVAPDALVPYVPVLLPQFVDAVVQVRGRARKEPKHLAPLSSPLSPRVSPCSARGL